MKHTSQTKFCSKPISCHGKFNFIYGNCKIGKWEIRLNYVYDLMRTNIKIEFKYIIFTFIFVTDLNYKFTVPSSILGRDLNFFP